jgi:hypothetical protein
MSNPLIFSGATRNRTGDTRIFSPLLYQLLWHHHVVLYIVVSITGAKVGIIFNPANVLKEKFTGQ